MRARILGWILMFALAFAAVKAEPVSVNITEPSDNVEAGSDAVFRVIITNNQDERDVFKIVGDDFAVYPFSSFASLIKAEPAQVKLNPEESAEVTITVKTLDTAKINTKYITKIKVASLINPAQKTTFEVTTFLVSAKDIIEIIPSLPDEIKPGEEIVVPIVLKNRAYIPLNNIEIYMASGSPIIGKSITVNFKEREEMAQEMRFMFDDLVQPGFHEMSIKAYEGENIRGSFTENVIVVPKENIKESKKVEKGFLSSITTITQTNKGNILAEQRIETRYSLLKRIFTTVEPEADKERGKYVWQFALNPGEEATITITTNYRPLFYGFIVILLFTVGMLYYIERSVVLRKRIFRIKEESQGISEFKILLHLRNGKKYVLREVKVFDILPHIIKSTQEFGTLKPSQVQKGKRSVRLVWEIGDLEPKEERVLSYKVRSKINLLGEVNLPAATVHFNNNKGKIVELKSLRLKVIKKEK